MLEDPVAKAIELSKIPKIEDELTESIDGIAVNAYFKKHKISPSIKLDKLIFSKTISKRIANENS